MKNIDFTYLEGMAPLVERIKNKKAILDNARPLPSGSLHRVKHDLALEWTYNSNSIEGNSLTLAETRVVLEDGITIGGKPLKEHFEAINHDKAIGYLEGLLDDSYALRCIDILHLHELVMKNIDDQFAGRIRNGMVRIVGANFTPPSPDKISDLLNELLEDIHTNVFNLDIPILASFFHHRLVWIHPFFDGNGRTGRLAMNLLLMKYGFPPAIILKNDRIKYYSALNQANKGDFSKISLLVLQALERSLNMYMNIIPDEYEQYESIAQIAKDPLVPYGMEYISLLARTGKIDAYKDGRNWLTTKSAVLGHSIR
ncbi:MAG: Fic family protein [Saprospiraceae bacterium]|nr:Fic family protein [Saprospiraceae bacterium]